MYHRIFSVGLLMGFVSGLPLLAIAESGTAFESAAVSYSFFKGSARVDGDTVMQGCAEAQRLMLLQTVGRFPDSSFLRTYPAVISIVVADARDSGFDRERVAQKIDGKIAGSNGDFLYHGGAEIARMTQNHDAQPNAVVYGGKDPQQNAIAHYDFYAVQKKDGCHIVDSDGTFNALLKWKNNPRMSDGSAMPVPSWFSRMWSSLKKVTEPSRSTASDAKQSDNLRKVMPASAHESAVPVLSAPSAGAFTNP